MFFVVSVPDAILQKLKQILREKKQEAEAKKGVQHFQIWDFAGQDVYYTTHQVRAIILKKGGRIVA